VGSIAIDMLSSQGYSVTALTGRDSQRDYLQTLGAKQVVLRDELLINNGPMESARFAAAIDNVGGDLLSWLIRSLRNQGSVASVGMTGGSNLSVSVMPFILRGVNVLGINSGATPRELREQIWRRISTDLRPSRLAVIRTRIVEFDELQKVFPEYLHNHTHGRTVVRIAH
jgi:putative YhdH/YhfP family quinone oxidoreductase